jgi:pyruvate kinase
MERAELMNSSHSVINLRDSLEELYLSMKKKEDACSFLTEKVHPSQKASAANLLHYLYLRSIDLGPLQQQLHLKGLSALTNAEGYVQSQLLNVLRHFEFEDPDPVPCDYFTADELITQRVNRLFEAKTRSVPSIMVTFKTSFAHDFIMVRKLLKAGMNVARINCAHDDEKTWLQMVKAIRSASSFTGLPCKIYMDLAGPKIRTKIKAKKNRIIVEEEDIILLTEKEDIKSNLPVVECSLKGIVDQLKPGERIFFDDGLIETRMKAPHKDGAELEVMQVSSKKPYLKAEKGINFPDSRLRLSALSDYDRRCLPFIKKYADMIGYSFIHNSPDLEELQEEMKGSSLPVVLKIETPEAMRNLPSLFFTAMKEPIYGVMIARGDLAVELGFENVSKAQDEIIGLCRAAHAPVIYATQILENLNKKGLPTRAEITDAAYGIWANCVMLNKGVHTAKVIKTLKVILQEKARQVSRHHPVFRPLKLSKIFFESVSASDPTV